mmetsp:Transcript_45004/g.105142  ORF Transcript_45004/g.105142 Transcript_45004/m.105142 type:complete len:206 (-) Transcript_45004:816-1433(-)
MGHSTKNCLSCESLMARRAWIAARDGITSSSKSSAMICGRPRKIALSSSFVYENLNCNACNEGHPRRASELLKQPKITGARNTERDHSESLSPSSCCSERRPAWEGEEPLLTRSAAAAASSTHVAVWRSALAGNDDGVSNASSARATALALEKGASSNSPAQATTQHWLAHSVAIESETHPIPSVPLAMGTTHRFSATLGWRIPS